MDVSFVQRRCDGGIGEEMVGVGKVLVKGRVFKVRSGAVLVRAGDKVLGGR